MAIVFDTVDIRGLRATHFEQLLAYLQTRSDTDWYYGNREQFEKRHKELEQWLVSICVQARSEGVTIPKKHLASGVRV